MLENSADDFRIFDGDGRVSQDALPPRIVQSFNSHRSLKINELVLLHRSEFLFIRRNKLQRNVSMTLWRSWLPLLILALAVRNAHHAIVTPRRVEHFVLRRVQIRNVFQAAIELKAVSSLV